MPKPGARIPPTIPEETRKMVLCVPDSVEWIALVTGCLAQLQFGWYYNKASGDYVAQVERAREMYFQFQDQNGLCDVIDCEEVADCIETSESVQNAINNLLMQYGGGSQGYPLPQSALDTPLNQGWEICDDDALWGACLNTVVTMNRRNEDFFQDVAAAANNQEALNYIIGAIPVLETLPIDELVALAQKINEFVQEYYLAAWDVEKETEFACALYCAAKANDCKLTAQVVTDYFWFEASLVAGWEDAFESAESIIGAMANWTDTIAGDAIVVTMFGAQVGFMTFLNSALGTNFQEFSLKAHAGIPDDSWQDCPSCPVIPNISLRDTFPGLYDTNPVFIENTPEGGSIWECTYVSDGVNFVVPVTPHIGATDVCCILVSASPVTSYQHRVCGGGLVSGSGSGAGATQWEDLGFIHSSGVTITIEIEPIP